MTQKQLKDAEEALQGGNALSSADLERMADMILGVDDNNPHKGNTEYPILSERQLQRRREKEVSYEEYIGNESR